MFFTAPPVSRQFAGGVHTTVETTNMGDYLGWVLLAGEDQLRNVFGHLGIHSLGFFFNRHKKQKY